MTLILHCIFHFGFQYQLIDEKATKKSNQMTSHHTMKICKS